MADQTTPGILLRGADGSQYFIPATDLSSYRLATTAQDLPAGVDQLKVDAYAMARGEGSPEGSAAFLVATPEGGPEGAAAMVATPEGGAANMPTPEGGPGAAGQA